MVHYDYEKQLEYYPPLHLDLDIHRINRDELRWINSNCSTMVIDELVEKIMKYNERLEHERQLLKMEQIQIKNEIKKTSWVPSPQAPKPKLMKKAPRILKILS